MHTTPLAGLLHVHASYNTIEPRNWHTYWVWCNHGNNRVLGRRGDQQWARRGGHQWAHRGGHLTGGERSCSRFTCKAGRAWVGYGHTCNANWNLVAHASTKGWKTYIYNKTIASILTYFALCFVLLTYFFFSRSGNLLFGITLWSIFRLSGCTWLIVAPLIFVGCWLWPSNTNTGHVFSKTWVARPMWTICQSVLCETQQAFQLPSLCLVSESLEYIQKTCIYMCMSNCDI